MLEEGMWGQPPSAVQVLLFELYLTCRTGPIGPVVERKLDPADSDSTPSV